MPTKLLPYAIGAALAVFAAAPSHAAPAASPPAVPPAKAAAPAAPAATVAKPAASSPAVFPAKIDAKYAKQSAGQGRMHTCLDQYNANKAANANGGMTWIQKGGGYYPMCTKKLKG